MYYIPEQWLKDPKNACKVKEILERNLHSNLNPTINHAIIELELIKETTIIERIRDGSLKEH